MLGKTVKAATVKGSKEAETGADARAMYRLIDSLTAKMDANNTIIKKRPSMQVPKPNLVDTDEDESDGTMMVSRNIGHELKAQEVAASSCARCLIRNRVTELDHGKWLRHFASSCRIGEMG